MQDAFGTELSVGDIVVAIGQINGMELVKLTVAGFTAHKIKLVGGYKQLDFCGTWLPKQVMKVESK